MQPDEKADAHNNDPLGVEQEQSRSAADGENDDAYADENYFNEISTRRSFFMRIVALVTAVAFLGLIVSVSWPKINLPLANLVSESMRLEQDIDIQRLQGAVVKIDVLAKINDSTIAVAQKSGTGFNIDDQGLIVTNHHVIDGALNMTITFPNGQICKANYWSSKPEFDLAIIGLEADNLPVVPLNTKEPPVSGAKVRVVGNPLGLNNIVAEGELKQYLKVSGNPEKVFSISAPIYPGNSGSPVFDRNGQVVGVVFATMQKQNDGKSEVIGLAVPVAEVLNMKKK